MSDWPSTRDLNQLVKESFEHQRSWGLIRGLARTIQEAEVTPTGSYSAEKRAEHVQRIQDLEAKVIAQKATIRQLEECRAFEAETERILSRALGNVEFAMHFREARDHAKEALAVLKFRKGPRPAEEGA